MQAQAASFKENTTMKNRWNRVLSIVVAGLFGIAATGAALAADPNELLTSLSGKVLSQGPNGEQPESVGNIRLTPDELSRIKNLHATAAIIMHYSGDDWSRAQINGLTQQFKSMGIKVIGVTDAGFKPEKQVSDIETMLVRKPNIIVSSQPIRLLPRALIRKRPIRASNWYLWTMFPRD